MKLSSILATENLESVTIDINKEVKVKATMFFHGGKIRTKKYSSLEIDIELKESDLSLVKHLGITRYRSFKSDSFYANIYNYD